MKNAIKHAEKLRSLFKSLLKDHKPVPVEPMEPLKALVRGAMSFDVSDNRAEEAMRLIGDEFVDLNELRVATDLEIEELLGSRYPNILKRVEMITRGLNAIFEKEHTLSLDRLKELSKRDARQFLRDLPEIHPFVEAYVMLFAFDGHAVPVDEQMLEYLRAEGAQGETATLEDAQKFLEHQVKAEECRDLYHCIRRAASDERRARKAKA